MPRVVQVGPELYPIPPIRGGAAELFIEKVSARLTTWNPVVIGVSDPQLPIHEMRHGVEYFRIPLEGWRKWLYCRYRHLYPLYDEHVAKIISIVQPDLVHIHNRPLLALSLKQRLGEQAPPLILHLHNLYGSLGKRERPDPNTPVPVAGLVTCSQFVLDREADRLGRAAALRRVVYNGVDPQDFLPLWDQGARGRWMRRQYQIGQEPTVLFAGKLRESKGVHVLVQAMEEVWQACPGTVLVLVGGTEYGRKRTMRHTPFLKDLRRRLATARGRVVLTGFIRPEDMPQTYLLGDIFVGPSQIEEGLGLVFLEASAAGLPVIASRMGGIPEVVRDGETGLLLKHCHDAKELAAKIILLLREENLRKSLGLRGREWVVANFSWERIAQSLEDVYDEVLSQVPE